MIRRHVLPLGVAVLVLLSGCTTERVVDFERTGLFGVVIDEDGQPIPGARVTVRHRRAETDPFGRFSLDRIPPGRHRIAVERQGYEAWEEQTDVVAPTQYLHVRLISVAGLVDRALADARAGDPAAVAATLKRIEAIAPEDPRTVAITRWLEGVRQ